MRTRCRSTAEGPTGRGNEKDTERKTAASATANMRSRAEPITVNNPPPLLPLDDVACFPTYICVMVTCPTGAGAEQGLLPSLERNDYLSTLPAAV